MREGRNMPKWLACCLVTVVAWGCWAVAYKAQDLRTVSAVQSQVFSTAGIVPIMLLLLPVMAARRASPSAPGMVVLAPGVAGARAWLTPRMRAAVRGSSVAFAAGLLVALGNVAYYEALAAGAKASTAASLTALYPLATVVLAVLFLGEKPSGWQAAGIVGSIGAICLLNVSSTSEPSPAWMRFALGPILLWGAAALVMKRSTDDVSAETCTFWFLAAFVPLAAAIVAFEPIDWNLSARQQLLLALLGLSYGVGNLGLLAAFRLGGKASIVTPLTGLYPVITIPLAMVFFGELVAAREWWGMGLALASAALLTCESRAPAPLSVVD